MRYEAYQAIIAALLVATFHLTVSGFDGEPSRELQVIDLSGHKVAPFHSSSGKPVVFFFVALDCPISNRYAPEITQLFREHGREAAFWLVYPSRTASRDVLQQHYQEFGYSLPALHDVDQHLVRSAGVSVTPEVAVYDESLRLVYRGRIDNRFVSLGTMRARPTVRDLDDVLVALRSGTPVAPRTTSAIGCYVS